MLSIDNRFTFCQSLSPPCVVIFLTTIEKLIGCFSQRFDFAMIQQLEERA